MLRTLASDECRDTCPGGSRSGSGTLQRRICEVVGYQAQSNVGPICLLIVTSSKLLISVWLRGSTAGEHYTARAYWNDGKVVGSIHVGIKDEEVDIETGRDEMMES